jgi:uncharacterized protein (UPF0332 family)
MPKPDDLLRFAEEGMRSRGAGAPRQAVLGRSISTAYYAVFHELLGQVSQTFVGSRDRKAWSLFYRSLDHAQSKNRCKRIGRPTLDDAEAKFFGIPSFGNELRIFANLFVQLQEQRHRCDYDPEFKVTKAQAQEWVDAAGQAIQALRQIERVERIRFLSYMLFGLRSYG